MTPKKALIYLKTFGKLGVFCASMIPFRILIIGTDIETIEILLWASFATSATLCSIGYFVWLGIHGHAFTNLDQF